MTEAKELPILLRQDNGDVNPPFKGDLFNRSKLAERLEQHIARLPQGGVFVIDAPWGDGKTWFARHWAASLNAKGFSVIYIDAFQSDYLDDPFLVLTAEIVEMLKRSAPAETKRIVDAGKRVGKAILPIAAKVAIGAASRIVLGNVDGIDDIKEAIYDAQTDVGDAVEKQVEKRLAEYAADKKSIDHFRHVLADLAEKGQNPIVIMVDELDRCRPDFAVQSLERIKHFFDVPKVVFVLFLNRTQLIESIKGVYGSGIDANSYLSKFVDFSVLLPKKKSFDQTDDSRTYCDDLLRRYGFVQSDFLKAFASSFCAFANFFALSLRGIERGIILFSLGQPTGRAAPLAGWLIALKLHRPDVFAGVLSSHREAHEEALRILEKFEQTQPAFWCGALLRDLHTGHLNEFKTPFSDRTKELLSMMGYHSTPSRYLEAMAEQLDLTVTR